jgi:hypothetical protein
MFQRTREWLTLALIGLLPFHALLVTLKTKLILGPGHPPMATLALWKEGMLLVILGLAFFEIVFRAASGQRLAASRYSLPAFRPDLLDAIIALLLILSLIVTALTHGNWSLYAFGFRYDFIPLIAFLVLRRVSWSEWFISKAQKVVLISACIVSIYALLTLLLPDSFFRALGYSDLHSLYVPGGPIAAFQLIGETGLHRLQGTMSGPNQLGLWLLIPLGIAMTQAMNRKKRGALLLLFGLTLLLTFSRAAWIGALVLVIATSWPMIRRMSKRAIVSGAAAIILLCIIAGALFPSVILRLRSSEGHLKNPIAAIERMVAHPLGEGLGTAGPASNRVSDACVLLGENDDATWAVNHPDLCVFLGTEQVQPLDRECNCPFLPENWYLQIGVEMGWIGFVLYLAFMGVVMHRLRVDGQWSMVNGESRLSTIYYPLATFLAVSTAALFLHAFEDAALAYTLWILIAAALPIVRRQANP